MTEIGETFRVAGPVTFPIKAGTAQAVAFGNNGAQGTDCAVAIYFGEESFVARENVPLRVHSSCFPSEVLGASDCDCAGQLDASLAVARREGGLVIYLFQEGRGAGLFSKIEGIGLSQASGATTYEAYDLLGLSRDSREYGIVPHVLRHLKVESVILLTNNPEKSRLLRICGVDIASTRRIFGTPSPANLEYLWTKHRSGGHILEGLFSDDVVCVLDRGLGFKFLVIDDPKAIWLDDGCVHDFLRADLLALKDDGFSIILCLRGDVSMAMDKLSRAHIAHAFDGIIFGSGLQPGPRSPIEILLERVRIDRLTYLGDRRDELGELVTALGVDFVHLRESSPVTTQRGHFSMAISRLRELTSALL